MRKLNQLVEVIKAIATLDENLDKSVVTEALLVANCLMDTVPTEIHDGHSMPSLPQTVSTSLFVVHHVEGSRLDLCPVDAYDYVSLSPIGFKDKDNGVLKMQRGSCGGVITEVNTMGLEGAISKYNNGLQKPLFGPPIKLYLFKMTDLSDAILENANANLITE